MKQAQFTLDVESTPAGFTDITPAINRCIKNSGIQTGLLTVFVKHTSAGLTIQENADPDVLADLKNFFDRTVPQDNSLYTHTYEGKDDMPAHIRSVLTNVSVTIPVTNGRAALGTWQAVYLCEYRNQPHIRHIVLHLIGE
ncbi:MAG: secondary thiamine-phosphate synthase enzyme YjbQ [Alphaproteobacteria bacterium]